MKVIWSLQLAGLYLIIGVIDGTNLTEKLQRQNVLLARQVMMQQFFNEERIRSNGNSGVKVKRQRNDGTRPYYEDTFTGDSFLSMHDHADHRYNIGLGEFVAVLNGVEFRTRHGDYALHQPSQTSNEYHAVEPIELPDVPPEVLAKTSVQEQIEEMRMWFKAFQDGIRESRDYRKYFKPVLCYLEGAWTLTDPEDSIAESHEIDGNVFTVQDWNELHRKARFASYSGSKVGSENIAFLPTTIVDMVNDTEPVFAQWDYRIMCHPVRRWIDPNWFRLIDDLAVRVGFGNTMQTHVTTRSARFQLNPVNDRSFVDGHTYYTELDRLMMEIPGKDNYNQFLKDDTFGLRSKSYVNVNTNLNAARYHRWYQVPDKGANGRQHLHRSFSDSTVFMAMNTRSQIAEQTVHDECKRKRSTNEKICRKTYKQRWSYAIPLEVIYLTPLGKWNPYNIEYIDDDVGEVKGRNGGFKNRTAFDRATRTQFYLTPSAFFSGAFREGDAADTSQDAKGMLNKTGHVCSVMASGVYIKLPEIEGVGEVRMRYPIAPVHQEGEAIWKELQAFKDLMLLQENKFKRLRDEVGLTTNFERPMNDQASHYVMLTMSKAPANPALGITQHTHTVTLTQDNIVQLKSGKGVTVTTNIASGHSHTLKIKYERYAQPPYSYVKCGNQQICFDQHGQNLYVVKDNED